MSALAEISRNLPSLVRGELQAPISIDKEKRTVEVVWSTGAPVIRYDWWEGEYYEETLSLAPEHCDISRLQSGASVLDTHGMYFLGDVIGSTLRAWLEPNEGRAVLKISDRNAFCEEVWKGILDTTIRAISIGYRVYKYEIIKEQGQMTKWRAIKWQPYEISFVPVGADPGAGVRSFSIEHSLQRSQPQQIEPCTFVQRSFSRMENQATTEQRTTTSPATPTPEERLRKLEIRAEEFHQTNLRLMEETGKLRSELDLLKKVRSEEVAAQSDERADAEFKADRAAGKHYFYTTEEQARADFKNNKRRYEDFCNRAPVSFTERSQSTSAQQKTQRAPQAPEALPSSSELRDEDDSNAIYRAVVAIQDEALRNGRSMSYSEATDEYHRREETKKKIKRT